MKKFILLSFAFLAATLSLASCQKPDNESETPKVYCSYYDLIIESLEFKLYDFTIVYNDIRLNEIHTSVLTGQWWTYGSDTDEPNFDKFVLKVEGKLKPNAADIVKDLVAAGKPLESGYKYTFKAGYYEDAAKTKLISTLVDESDTIYGTVQPDKFEAVLSTPVITIIDITK